MGQGRSTWHAVALAVAAFSGPTAAQSTAEVAQQALDRCVAEFIAQHARTPASAGDIADGAMASCDAEVKWVVGKRPKESAVADLRRQIVKTVLDHRSTTGPTGGKP